MPADNSSLQRILIVEDEENARKGYEALLRKWNCEVLGVPSGEDALAKIGEFNPQVILADVELPGMNGLDLLRHLGEEMQRIPVIIITGRGSDERVVQAIDAGAFWYIEKPLKPPVLRALLDRALGRVRDQQAVAALTRQLREAGKLGALVGSSAPMQEVMRQVEMAAPSTASVLITGRNRIRQGDGGAVDPHAFAARRPAVRGHQLLGDSRIADGERNFRAREGRIHGRGGAAHRLLRTGARRDAAAG